MLLSTLHWRFLVSVSVSVSDFVISLYSFVRLFSLHFFCYLDMNHLIKALNLLENQALILKFSLNFEWEFNLKNLLHLKLRFSQDFQKNLYLVFLSIIKLDVISETVSFWLLWWLILNLLVTAFSAECVSLSFWIRLTRCSVLSVF